MKRIVLFLLVVGGVLVSRAWCQQPGQSPAAEAAIRAVDELYTQAFNNHDARAMAEFWSPDAVYLDRTTGDQFVGRAAIAEHLAHFFKHQSDVKLSLSVDSIRFLSPNVAIESGTAKTLSPSAAPDEGGYSAVYVKRDGRWLLDRVTDEASEVAPTHYQQLKALEWMVGRWVDRDKEDDVTITTECNWTKNQNFLTRSFTVTTRGHIDMSGMQIVGWDPARKTIRSWTFDSNGGFAEATWTRKGQQWFIYNKGVLADGRPASMVNIIKQLDKNSFTWQTVDRTAGGELLPNINEVVIERE